MQTKPETVYNSFAFVHCGRCGKMCNPPVNGPDICYECANERRDTRTPLETHISNPKAKLVAGRIFNALTSGCINSLTEPEMTRRAIAYALEQAELAGDIKFSK